MGRSLGVLVASMVLVLSWAAMPSAAAPFNITLMLNAYPSLTGYNQLLSSTGVAEEINKRTSVTVLVVPDSILAPFLAGFPNADSGQVADLVRYNVLLQYFDLPGLRNSITVGNPTTVTTLYQTTGQAAGNSGAVNLYNDGTTLQVGQADVNSPPNATIVRNVTQIPYNVSILELDHVVTQAGFGVAATGGANLTAILQTGKNFNTLIGLLQSTGVDAVFAGRETGTGITIFAPTDAAFAALPVGLLAAATDAQKKLILEYHALTSYYTLGSLNTLNKADAPTVATTDGNTGKYLLNVTTGPNGVVLNSGVTSATIASTLYDTPPTVVFSVGTILLPRELVALAPAPAPIPGPVPAPAPANASAVPVPAPSPANASVPVPAPSPLLTPTPAPSPLSLSPTPTPTPTPHPAPAPSPRSPSPAPTPAAVSPGPPAPPTGSIGGSSPELAPEGGPSPEGSHATTSSISIVFLGLTAFVSSFVVMTS